MNSTPRPPRLVACPICKKTAEWSTGNPFRPFCSERCKLIDLGQWATESYSIPDQEIPPDDSAAPKH